MAEVTEHKLPFVDRDDLLLIIAEDRQPINPAPTSQIRQFDCSNSAKNRQEFQTALKRKNLLEKDGRQ